jgi:hypothetical protein
MSHSFLGALKSNDFHARAGFVATPTALHRLLRKSREVQAIRKGLETGELGEQMIHKYVDSLMNDLRPGQPFQHDLAISALAVALEKRGTEFAEEFLQDLARLKAAEMSMSIRVARECLKDRVTLAGNKKRVVQLAAPERMTTTSYEELGERYPRKQTRQARQVVKCGEA